jgi:hypothetical protein
MEELLVEECEWNLRVAEPAMNAADRAFPHGAAGETTI